MSCRQTLPKQRQASLFTATQLGPLPHQEHGGSTRTGRRKVARPLDTRRPVHVVLRSSRAKGSWSLRRAETAQRIRVAMSGLAEQYDIRIYEFANSATHLHLLLRAKQRASFQAFLRAFAGIAARCATGARKGHPIGRFWDELAYSRLLHWGREFAAVRAYVVQNEEEALGLVPYRPRRRERRRDKIPKVE